MFFVDYKKSECYNVVVLIMRATLRMTRKEVSMKARIGTLAVLPLLVSLALVQTWADDPRAIITLGTDPEPPICVGNPGGTVEIFWDIQYQTTPDSVTYELCDPTQAVVEREVYPGDSGIQISRDWTVPAGADPGGYWVYVNYYSAEVGNEANADVLFLVCEPIVPLRETDWGQIKRLFQP